VIVAPSTGGEPRLFADHDALTSGNDRNRIARSKSSSYGLMAWCVYTTCDCVQPIRDNSPKGKGVDS